MSTEHTPPPNKLASLSLAYFRATGHDFPSHVTDRTAAAFILSEMRRYGCMPGVSSRLSVALREFER